MRLHPGAKLGVSCRRNHGSLTSLARYQFLAPATSEVSGVFQTSAMAAASEAPSLLARSSCCTAGKRAKSHCTPCGIAVSERGITHPAVR